MSPDFTKLVCNCDLCRAERVTKPLKPEFVYLAGPMRGIRDFNFPAFHEATAYLRSLGLEVFSAAEMEEQEFGKGFNKSETGDLKDISMPGWDFREQFSKDCRFITLHADAVVCLTGWEKSSGARAEVAVARAIGVRVLEYPTLREIHEKLDIKIGLQIVGIGGAPTRATILPTKAEERKQYPVASGCLDYFPDALAAISNVSQVGNDQHNPGKPLHWDRSKSGDEADTMIRHFLQRGMRDKDGVRHTAKMAWRALALLQKEIEAERK